jgi:hypothetical protein
MTYKSDIKHMFSCEYIDPEHIIEHLISSLQKIESEENDEISIAEKSIGICSTALLELREYANHSYFKSKEEEIHF